MCGLGGMAGPGVSKDDLNWMQDVAYLLGLRGLDSTGIAQGHLYKHRCDVFIDKAAMDVGYWSWYNRWHEKGNKRVMNNVGDNVFMLHTRAATLGTVSNMNAHPHVTKNLIGMHNGTLADKKYIPRDDGTDSALLYADIDERGVETVMKSISEQSAYALVWIDRKRYTLNFLRNDKRPLFCAFNTKRRVFYWASEEWMITAAASRHGIEISEVMYFEPHTHYEMLPEDVRTDDLPDWNETSGLKPEPKPVQVHGAQFPASSVLAKGGKNATADEIAEFEAIFQKGRPSANSSAASAFKIANQNDLKKVVDLVSRPKDTRITGKRSVPDTGSWNSKSPEYKRLHPRPVEHKDCKYCRTELDLVGQFFATACKEEAGKLICEDCTKRIKELKEENNLKTVNSIIM